MFKKDENKIKRRETPKNKPQSIKKYVIISVVAWIVLVATVLYLCIAVLSHSPEEFFETSFINPSVSLDKIGFLM